MYMSGCDTLYLVCNVTHTSVQILLSYGAGESKETALSLASARGNLAMVRFLLGGACGAAEKTAEK